MLIAYAVLLLVFARSLLSCETLAAYRRREPASNRAPWLTTLIVRPSKFVPYVMLFLASAPKSRIAIRYDHSRAGRSKPQ